MTRLTTSHFLALLAAPAALGLSPLAGHAALSTDPLNPTVLPFSPGGIVFSDTNVGAPANSTSGTQISPASQYVTFTVPDGFVFKGLSLTNYSSSDDRGFVALKTGSSWPLGTSMTAQQRAGLSLAYNHFGTGTSGTRPQCSQSYAGSAAQPGPNPAPPAVNTNVCINEAAANSDLFSRNLLGNTIGAQPAGSYTVWIQQTVATAVTFTFEAQFQAVPSPLPLLGAAAGFGLSRRLRQRIRTSRSAA